MPILASTMSWARTFAEVAPLEAQISWDWPNEMEQHEKWDQQR